MKLSLVVMASGKQEGKVLEIKLPQFVVGRDPQCHLRPASAVISKRHCALLQRDGKAFIRDFDSTNGTFVNDQPVKGEVELHNEDKLKIGPLLFTVRIEAASPVNRPTPPPPTKSAPKTAALTPPTKAVKPGTLAKPAAPAKAKEAAAPAEAPKTEELQAEKEGTAETPAAGAPSKGSQDEDDIAAMLLSLQDDSGAGLSSPQGEVPEGSTVMDLVMPPGAEGAAKPGEKKDDKADKAKTAAANTSNAAKSILEKYMKRPRG